MLCAVRYWIMWNAEYMLYAFARGVIFAYALPLDIWISFTHYSDIVETFSYFVCASCSVFSNAFTLTHVKYVHCTALQELQCVVMYWRTRLINFVVLMCINIQFWLKHLRVDSLIAASQHEHCIIEQRHQIWEVVSRWSFHWDAQGIGASPVSTWYYGVIWRSFNRSYCHCCFRLLSKSEVILRRQFRSSPLDFEGSWCGQCSRSLWGYCWRYPSQGYWITAKGDDHYCRPSMPTVVEQRCTGKAHAKQDDYHCCRYVSL